MLVAAVTVAGGLSPRTRGELEHHCRESIDLGSIPAHAGGTVAPGNVRRGDGRGVRRSIPAHAGGTRSL